MEGKAIAIKKNYQNDQTARRRKKKGGRRSSKN
jgi:hypothetical protein